MGKAQKAALTKPLPRYVARVASDSVKLFGKWETQELVLLRLLICHCEC